MRRLCGPERAASLLTAAGFLANLLLAPVAAAHNVELPGGISPSITPRPSGGQGPSLNASHEEPSVQSDTDPVDVARGEYVLTRRDIFLRGRGLSLDLVFTYRSRSASHSPFGYGWDMSYHRRVRKLSNNNALVLRGNGRVEEFTSSGPSAYTPPPGVYDSLVQNPDGTHLLTSKHGLKESYDVNGNLTRIEDRSGNALTFTYDPAGKLPLSGLSDYFVVPAIGVIARDYRLTRITDTVGRNVDLAYTSDGHLDTLTYAGRTIRYGYDAGGGGDVTNVTIPATSQFPWGSTTTYAYLNHNLTSITDPKGQAYLTNVYDAATDRLTEQTYGNGTSQILYTTALTCPSTPGGGQAGYTLSLSPLSVSTSGTFNVTWSVPAERASHPNDRIGLFRLDQANTDPTSSVPTNGVTLSTETLPAGTVSVLHEARYILDDTVTSVAHSNTACVGTAPLVAGAVTQADVIDRNGFTTRYQFDAAGHVTRIEQLTDGVPAGEPASYVTTHEYDSAGNRIRTVFPRGNAIEYAYDTKGNLLETRRKRIGATPFVNDPTDLVTTFTYESQFNLIKTVTDPRGNVTTYTYDYELSEPAKGNLRRITAPMVDGQTIQASFTYNAFGQVLTATDPNGLVTTYAYHATSGELLQVTRGTGTPQAATTSLAYDAVGNVTSLTDPRGNVTTFTYDERNQLITTTAPTPFSFETHLGYDENGNVIQVDRQAVSGVPMSRPALGTTDPDDDWQSTVYAYTARDELASVTDDLGQTTAFAYDGTGNRRTVTDALSRITTYAYDERDLLASVTDAATPAGVTAYAYDANGNLASLTDAESRTTTYTYDDFDRLTRLTYPGGTFEQYGYDAASNLTSRTTPANQPITYTYDALNRLRTKITPEETTTYAYDVGSRLTEATDAQAALTFVYDALNRVLQAVTDPAGALAATTVASQYDIAGNRTRLTYPDASFITATYDQLNRPDLIRTQTGGTIADLGYDALSRRTQRSLPNTTTTYAYDAVNRLTSLEARNTSQTLLTSSAYTYDAVGNRQTLTTPDGLHTYGYDLREQLTSVDAPSGSPFADATFTYDQVGNRTQVTQGSTTLYTPSTLNQYASVGSIPFTYDPNGNLTSDGTRTYTYDSESRLLTATGPSLSASYTYDPFGRRLSKTVNGVTTRYLYDGDQLLVETDATGTQTASWVYGPGIDEPLRMVRGAITTYYHQDGLGSVVLLTAPNTLPVEYSRYDAFGQVALTNGSGTPLTQSARGNPFTFTGREYDPETGLLYYRARYYDPRLGRFVSRDPLGYLPDMNLYRYVNNNPTRWVDPYGFSLQGTGPLNPGPLVDQWPGIFIPPVSDVWPSPVVPPIIDQTPSPDTTPIVDAWPAPQLGAIIDQPTPPSSTSPAAQKSALGVKATSASGEEAKDAETKAKDQGQQGRESQKGTQGPTADEIIQKEKRGSIRAEFPGEWLDKTLEEIDRAAKRGDASARKARKLIRDRRFNK